MKSWPSQYGLEANALAIQVHGGYWYTREYPVERLYRDHRLNPIHEGTHGIQALDLLGRNVPMKDRAAFEALSGTIRATIDDCREIEALRSHAKALEGALELVDETTRVLLGALRADATLALANASTYLEMLGHVVVAWIWLAQALAAIRKMNGLTRDRRVLYEGKVLTCGWFCRWELPKIEAQAKLLKTLDRICLDVRVEQL